MPERLTYHIHKGENALYLCLEGDLDQKNFLQVSNALTGIELVLPVKVDMRKVKYADSTGLRSLVLLQRQARDAGVDFFLMRPSETVNRLFRTTGLAQVFRVMPSDEENPCAAD